MRRSTKENPVDFFTNFPSVFESKDLNQRYLPDSSTLRKIFSSKQIVEIAVL